jgi:hypothetical protein
MPSKGAAYKLCIDVIILQTPQTNTKAERIQANSLGWGVVQELVEGINSADPGRQSRNVP